MKSKLGQRFTFANLHKVYCIVLMEESPAAFHSAANQYIHRRTAVFNTGIYSGNAGLHEDIFICLDIFRSIVHTITKRNTLQEAWLTFLSADDIDSITALVKTFPMFLPIYQEISNFAKEPKELMNMFSEALRIMDRNLERMMVEEMREEYKAKLAAAEKAVEKAAAEAETRSEIFRLRLLGKSTEEIASTLSVPLGKVEDALSFLTQTGSV